MAIGNKLYIIVIPAFLFVACQAREQPKTTNTVGLTDTGSVNEIPDVNQVDIVVPVNAKLLTGAEQTNLYFPLLKDKRIAVVANQTSVIGTVHLVDSLQASGFTISKVFSLEHGFRGVAQAGEVVKNEKDAKTGISIISLYGSSKKPKPEHLTDVDVIVFDIQDVGARFYTYISSLHYIMEAAAENKVEVIVLDRPNPNGFYVDGPILNMKHKSFVGMHPIPIVHGMTIAEYAQMINGEDWLLNGVKCKLTSIPCANYNHKIRYHLPIPPSPNLTNMQAIYLYPSLCLFEGTIVSVARGTDFPFQAIGFPGNSVGDFKFTPKSVSAAKNPPHKDVECIGYDLRKWNDSIDKNGRIELAWLLEFFKAYKNKTAFFESDGMFVLLSGSTELKNQILNNKSEEEIRKSWQQGLIDFKLIRKKYLLYEDFE